MNSRTLKLQAVRAVFAAALLATGCTTIPQGKFAAYRQAFGEARLQSESVLADYAAARQEKTNRLAASRQIAAGAVPAASLSANLGLDQFSARGAASATDDIEVRLRAWDIVDKYNEALLSVATGAKTAEIEGAVNGFLGHLKEFPVKEVATLAGDIVPYANVISEIVGIVQKEVEARRFRRAVLKAAPGMRDFVGLLYKDAELFRRYRMTLLDEEFDERLNDINGLVDRFRSLAGSHGWNSPRDVNALIQSINGHAVLVAGVQAFAPLNPVTNTAPASSAAQEQSDLQDLHSIEAALRKEADAARGVAAREKAFHELMQQYASLIRQLDSKLFELAAAVEKGTGQLPSVDQLQRVISSARIAHTLYTETK